MISPRETLQQFVDILMDLEATPDDQREAAQAWFRWALALLDIANPDDSHSGEALGLDSILETGKAISPLGAARCIWEYRRTSEFLRGVDAALQVAFARFPGEPIHLVEAGCGPLAPLSLPFALKYGAERLQITLLDIHALSLDYARRLAEKLEVQGSIRACLQTDAATFRFEPQDRPHVIACEVLLRALKNEPQVAVTRNLAPQLRPGGIFLPERIDVHAVLFDSGKYFSPVPPDLDLAGMRSRGVVELGKVYSLDVTTTGGFADSAPSDPVRIPAHSKIRTPLYLFTRIQVFGAHGLTDFESSLNLPEKIDYSEELAERGGEAAFVYHVGRKPGLKLRI